MHRHRYGTLRNEVEEPRRNGHGVILDIDVQGAAKVRPQYPEAVSIFLKTSTWELFETRLRNRRTESEADIALRLANARLEMERIGEYDHVIINDDLEVAFVQFRDLIASYFSKGKPCLTS